VRAERPVTQKDTAAARQRERAPGSQAVTVKQALACAARRLSAARIPSARLDAEVLLAETLDCSRERLYAESERVLTSEEQERFQGFVERRKRREPTAYIVGHRAFRTIDLQLNENTLIPRPETETLVEVVLEQLASLGKDEPRVLDLGTGSGNIALSIAHEHPTARIVATEVHPAPLEMARLNAVRLGLHERVGFIVSDLYEDLPPGTRFDLIVSNPPYVTAQALRRLSIDVRGYEPHVALLGGERGMDFYERIIPGAPPFLEPGGVLAVEIPETKLVEVLSLFVETCRFEDIDVRNDLGGSPRVVYGREKA
jgi:release factor glutamine methyltransferase